MTMKYQITKAASQDLDHILTYFQRHNLDAGERFVREFNKKCRNLVQFPKLGRRYDNVAPGLRGLPLQNYIILYKLVDGGIVIVRIASGYQDLKSLFSNEL